MKIIDDIQAWWKGRIIKIAFHDLWKNVRDVSIIVLWSVIIFTMVGMKLDGVSHLGWGLTLIAVWAPWLVEELIWMGGTFKIIAVDPKKVVRFTTRYHLIAVYIAFCTIMIHLKHMHPDWSWIACTAPMWGPIVIILVLAGIVKYCGET
jgi:hypothetical protein